MDGRKNKVVSWLTPKDTDRDVLVNIMEIDGDAYVTAHARKDKIRRKM